MNSEKFCLRWNDFETNINEAFKELRESNDFFDVTLVCENEQMQAHKVILSACSSFFRNMLRRNAHQHPLIYLKGVKFSDLQSVLNFMYQGEVSVAQEDLNSFLAVAEDLRVKGLTQNQSENQQSIEKGLEPDLKLENYPKAQPSLSKESRLAGPKRQKLYQPTPRGTFSTPGISHNVTSEDIEIQEVVPVKTEPEDVSALSTAPAQDILTPVQAIHTIATAEDTLDYQDEDYGEYEQFQETDQNQSMKGEDSFEILF